MVTPAGPASHAAGAAAEPAYACARAWAALTMAHARVTEQLTSELARRCGLSINDFEILVMVRQAPPGGLRQGALTGTVRLTQPALSRGVGRLEQRGWLRRADAADDGRCVLLSLTPAGHDVLGQAAAVHAQTIRELLLDRLTPDEQDVLAQALTRVADVPPAH